jgi:hypothetical protein
MKNQEIRLVMPNNEEGQFYVDKVGESVTFGGATRLVKDVNVTDDMIIVDFDINDINFYGDVVHAYADYNGEIKNTELKTFSSMKEAADCLNYLLNILKSKGVVAFADLHSTKGIICDVSSVGYGWKDLSMAFIKSHRDGFVLVLPKPVLLVDQNRGLRASMMVFDEKVLKDGLNNPYEEYVRNFALDNNISINEAYEHPMCKTRLKLLLNAVYSAYGI